ncbi:hypothetical protein ACROYT_G035052 [Oculina patagonica]
MKLYFTVLIAAIVLLTMSDTGFSKSTFPGLSDSRYPYVLNDKISKSTKAFKALVKPECRHLPVSMVQARPECLNDIDEMLK